MIDTTRQWLNSPRPKLRPRPHGRHFTKDIFKFIFLNEVYILSQILWHSFQQVQFTIIQYQFRSLYGAKQAISQYRNHWWHSLLADLLSNLYYQSRQLTKRKCSLSPLAFVLPNPLKSGIKSRLKILLEQHRQALLQLHKSDQQFYCLLRCDLY